MRCGSSYAENIMNAKAHDITVQRTRSPKQKPAWDDLPFGTIFTDHMFMMDYEEGTGWHSPRIVPYGPIPLDPAATVLHNAQAVFDGLKAYRGDDGTIRIFRPRTHAERLKRTCELMRIPTLEPELVVNSFRRLVQLERDWVPTGPGTSLYLRPTVIATEPFISVRTSRRYAYYVILSPVGPYYSAPARLIANETRSRAAPGGIGNAKAAANYAAGLPAVHDAAVAGYSQVLWLDAREHTYLEEAGNMNVMVRIAGTVITPPLAGTILPGVTRQSVLEILREWGERVEERPISIHEVVGAAREGTLQEMWGTGTAAIISQVSELRYRDETIIINGGARGPITDRLYTELNNVQYGRVPDTRGWTDVI
jgi:branched-chain amino acid aminotransferase